MRTLNVVFDVLTLICLSIAAIGLFAFLSMIQSLVSLPNIDNAWVMWLRNVTMSKVIGAFCCMGFLGFFLVLSLVWTWPAAINRMLNLGMFASSLLTMLYLIGLMTSFDSMGRGGFNRPQGFDWVRWDGTAMIVVAMVPTGFAIFFSLVRMIWTMPRGQTENSPVARPALPPLPQATAVVVTPDVELQRQEEAKPLANEQTGFTAGTEGS